MKPLPWIGLALGFLVAILSLQFLGDWGGFVLIAVSLVLLAYIAYVVYRRRQASEG